MNWDGTAEHAARGGVLREGGRVHVHSWGAGAMFTCGSRLGRLVLWHTVVRLDQDHTVALVVMDDVVDHGDFWHGVQLVCKVLWKRK